MTSIAFTWLATGKGSCLPHFYSGGIQQNNVGGENMRQWWRRVDIIRSTYTDTNLTKQFCLVFHYSCQFIHHVSFNTDIIVTEDVTLFQTYSWMILMADMHAYYCDTSTMHNIQLLKHLYINVCAIRQFWKRAMFPNRQIPANSYKPDGISLQYLESTNSRLWPKDTLCNWCWRLDTNPTKIWSLINLNDPLSVMIAAHTRRYTSCPSIDQSFWTTLAFRNT
jgi:hypothetical protein